MAGWEGGAGFFKRIRGARGSEILTLDPPTFEYRTRQKAQFPIQATLKNASLEDRLRPLAFGDDKAGRFVWETVSDLLVYAGHRADEIADSLLDIDHAVGWGFNWELGPFAMWDALGVARRRPSGWRRRGSRCRRGERAARLGADVVVPARWSRTASVFDLGGQVLPAAPPRDVIFLPDLKAGNRVVREAPEASLIDLGTGSRAWSSTPS